MNFTTPIGAQPPSALYPDNYLISTYQNTQSAAVTGQTALVAPEGKGIFGSIYTHDDRANGYVGTWTALGPWTNYCQYGAYTDNTLTQFINIALGDGYGITGTTTTQWLGFSNREAPRRLEFSLGNRLGHSRNIYNPVSNTSNTGICNRIMPLRNTTGNSITFTIYGVTSTYFSSGYEGATCFVLTPSGQLTSNPGNISSTVFWTNYSNNSTGNANNASITIPGNTTVLVCLASSDFFSITNYFYDTNYFYNLQNIPTGIICDMRMLSTLSSAAIPLPSTGAAVNTSLLAPIWTTCASLYGDR